MLQSLFDSVLSVITAGNPVLRLIVLVMLVLNALAVWQVWRGSMGVAGSVSPASRFRTNVASRFLVYEVLVIGAVVMLLPFYWMVVTAFKDGETAAAFPPYWTPTKIQTKAPHPETGELIRVVPQAIQLVEGEEIPVAPEQDVRFRRVERGGVWQTLELPDPDSIFMANPENFVTNPIMSLDARNFLRAWYRPEQTSRGEVNFLTYFLVSAGTSVAATTGTLFTSALAAFAFARLVFWGKTVLFYLILATMMVPGQVLLIPNFLVLSTLGMLDTYAALVVPWLASVFTIFLMRQFFMTIPEDLWDAARIDGSGRFRYLWQIVVPLSKPVFITAGIIDFLNNWNSLLWPLIVTSSPTKRTLMVGLQNLNDEAGTEFHILMAASCFAILPIVIVFFFLQRFFIEGIARTGLK